MRLTAVCHSSLTGLNHELIFTVQSVGTLSFFLCLSPAKLYKRQPDHLLVIPAYQ